MLDIFLLRILIPIKRLYILEPFIKIFSYLISYSRWVRFSSNLLAIRVTSSIGITEIIIKEKISPSRAKSWVSTISIAISLTKRFKTTYISIKKGQRGIN